MPAFKDCSFTLHSHNVVWEKHWATRSVQFVTDRECLRTETRHDVFEFAERVDVWIRVTGRGLKVRQENVLVGENIKKLVLRTHTLQTRETTRWGHM